MTDKETVALGHRAAHELELTEAAFEKVRAALIEKMIATPPERPDTILKLHMAAQTVTDIRRALFAMVQDGQVAEVALANSGLTRPV